MDPVHVSALGPGHRPTTDCVCAPIRSEVLGQAVIVHRWEQPDDGAEQCRQDPLCDKRAWSNGYCGPHQPAGPYGRTRHTVLATPVDFGSDNPYERGSKVAKPLDKAAP